MPHRADTTQPPTQPPSQSSQPSTASELDRLPVYPVCLTIAGSDSGGGAGIQADLHTFARLHAFGTSAITAITAQNPAGVSAIHPVPEADVIAQLDAVLAAFTVGAIKTGMLYSATLIDALAARLLALPAPRPPLIVDPVIVATSGARLLRDDAMLALCQRFLPLATVITPNLPEAALLLGLPHDALLHANDASRLDAARQLRTRYGCAILLKGGHLQIQPTGQSGPNDPNDPNDQSNRPTPANSPNASVTAPLATDLLLAAPPDGRAWRLDAPRLTVATSHGTGCTLGAAIAAGLANGQSLLDAVVTAKAFVHQALANCHRVGPRTAAMILPAVPDRTTIQVHPLP